MATPDGPEELPSASPLMSVEVHGVLHLHPWLGAVSIEHDLDEDLYSLAVKRSVAYGWRSSGDDADERLSGRRWGQADAGQDWSQDGRVRRVAWLNTYPTVGLRRQHLPILPMTRVLVDSLDRVGRLEFRELRSHVPVGTVESAAGDLGQEADWFAMADPDARTGVTVVVRTVPGPGPEEVFGEVARRCHGILRLRVSDAVAPDGVVGPVSPAIPLPAGPPMVFVGSAPEWTPDSAAWITHLVADALRSVGVAGASQIAVSGGAPAWHP